MNVINFHTHTCRCHHASGSVRDYLQAAWNAGVKYIGISDHSPEPLNSTTSRMAFEELDEYITEVRSAAKSFPDMTVFCGVEAECFPHFDLDDLRKVYVENNHFDYLIGSVHPRLDCPDDAKTIDGAVEICRKAVNENIRMIESGIFVCIAHPDMVGMLLDTWQDEYAKLFRQLITAANDCNVFLEFNTYGMRKPLKDTSAGKRWQYPLIPFWEIAAEMHAQAVIGIDAHRPQDVCANWDDAAKILNGLGLMPQNEKMLTKIRDVK